MTSTLNWKLRDYLHAICEPGDGREARLDVLIGLILHADQRNRTWVGEERLANETGFNTARVSAAINWLFEHGAIYNVPFKYRVGRDANSNHANTSSN